MRLLSFQKLTIYLAIISLLYIASFNARAISEQYLSHTLNDKQVLIRTDKAEVTLSAYGQGAIAVHYQTPPVSYTHLTLPTILLV